MNNYNLQSYFKTLFYVIALVIFSWIIVHLVAALGVFFAVAYPIWWLFAPQQTICFICRSKREGEYCPVCQRVKNSNDGIYPKNAKSVLLNGAFILIISVSTIGFVYIEELLLKKFVFSAPQTVSFVIPDKGQYRLGEVFPLKIELTGIKTPINTVQTDISFSPQKLNVVNISTQGSFANIFIQKEINNEAGYARLTGGLPNPGFSGDKGLFATFYFQAKEPGISTIEFLPTSMVLANDGKGTNVLKDYSKISYLVSPEQLTQDELNSQATLFDSSNVLGESTSSEMIFYDENQVLGISTFQIVKDKEKPNFLKKVFFYLNKLDTFILSLFSRKNISSSQK